MIKQICIAVELASILTMHMKIGISDTCWLIGGQTFVSVIVGTRLIYSNRFLRI